MHGRELRLSVAARLLVVLLAVVVAGCGADSSEDAASTPSAAPTERPACPNGEGGACLGRLSAGTYRTTVFSPGITYRVPKGWQNLEDTPGNFLLVPPGQELEGVAPPSSLTHGLIPGLAFRLYLLRDGDKTLAVEVDDVAGGDRLADLADVAEQLRFAP